LTSGRSEDPGATAGQLLVTFGWTAPVLMLMVVGVAWYAKTSD
jgi:hypothetical protein